MKHTRLDTALELAIQLRQEMHNANNAHVAEVLDEIVKALEEGKSAETTAEQEKSRNAILWKLGELFRYLPVIHAIMDEFLK